ncbi:MAG: tetratricopeptide repeat protein [Planctomycetes bacterium]|nr:tetratricopeptide repeat protein [Planctomycetota bacterium]
MFWLYLLSNWYTWPFIFAFVYWVSWPFIKAFRLWQAKRRFIRTQGAKLENPQNADARFQLANLYAEGGGWKKALQYAQHAVRVSQENPLYDGQVPYHFLRLLGDAYLHRKAYAESVEAYQRALAVKSDLGHKEAQFGLGLAFYRKGDVAKAYDALRRAVEDNGSHLEGYFRLAQAATDLGRSEEASRVKADFWRVAATLPRFAGRHRLRWRLAFAFFPLTRYFV